jgi:hypothetical protein
MGILTHPMTMNASSYPNALLARRTYVLNETVIIERPRKIEESTRIARGSPSGLIVLRVGSTVETGVDILTDSGDIEDRN